MPRYTVPLKNTPAAAANVTAGRIVPAATARVFVDELHFGSAKTPADAGIMLRVDRLDATGAGTATAITPQKCDPNDVAAKSSFSHNFTAEPTAYAAAGGAPAWPLLTLPLHMRGMCHWGAAPGKELVQAAAVTSILGVYTSEANGGGLVVHEGTLFFRE